MCMHTRAARAEHAPNRNTTPAWSADRKGEQAPTSLASQNGILTLHPPLTAYSRLPAEAADRRERATAGGASVREGDIGWRGLGLVGARLARRRSHHARVAI